FGIDWPSDADQVCSKPGPPSREDALPVHLSAEDRGRSNATYDQFALAIASYEAAPDISPFSSKFDYALAHADEKVLTVPEQAGWELFRGKVRWNTCQLDGTENVARAITPGNAASAAPLFTDFTSSNLGVPRNVASPFFTHNKPDQYGYIANPAGAAFVDTGVGGF